MQIRIRKYRTEDCPCLAQLFYDTIHTVNAGDYTQEQLEAWAPGLPDIEQWNLSFLKHETFVAETDGGIAGFGDIDETGYLDRLYVHKDWQRRGIASALCDTLEQAVSAEKIYTHASITARPFFLSRGYCVRKEQQVERRGILLTNFVMELVRPENAGTDKRMGENRTNPGQQTSEA